MLLLLLMIVFLLHLRDIQGLKYLIKPSLYRGYQLSMVAGKGFEKSQEVEISLDDTSVGQTEKDLLTGFVIFCGYSSLH